MAFVVMVDYMVELVELKANFSVTRFYILKTTQRERGPQALFRTVLTCTIYVRGCSGGF